MKNFSWLLLFTCVACFSVNTFVSQASDGGDREKEYITISIDASDNNEGLEYALDSDDPDAFGSSNVFVVEAGTAHTIYVKDIAGNIVSQTYQPSTGSNTTYEIQDDYSYSVDAEDTRNINIDVNLSNGRYTDAISGDSSEAAEDGTGTLYDKVPTDGSVESEKVFYTVTTKEGEVFYLVIDQSRGDDNVYLLNTVTVDELQALAEDNGYTIGMGSGKKSESSSSGNLLSALTGSDETIEDLTEGEDGKTKKSISGNKNTIIVVVLAAIVGGVYYYLKVYKKKKDASMDEIDNAMDLDEFRAEDSDAEDEIDMPMSDDEFYKDINQEEAYYDADPDGIDFYAGNGGGDEDHNFTEDDLAEGDDDNLE